MVLLGFWTFEYDETRKCDIKGRWQLDAVGTDCWNSYVDMGAAQEYHYALQLPSCFIFETT